MRRGDGGELELLCRMICVSEFVADMHEGVGGAHEGTRLNRPKDTEQWTFTSQSKWETSQRCVTLSGGVPVRILEMGSVLKWVLTVCESPHSWRKSNLCRSFSCMADPRCSQRHKDSRTKGLWKGLSSPILTMLPNSMTMPPTCQTRA